MADVYILLEAAVSGAGRGYPLSSQAEVRQGGVSMWCRFWHRLMRLWLQKVRALHMLVTLGLAAAVCARVDLHWFAHGVLVLLAGSVVLTVLYPLAPVSVNREGRLTWLMVHFIHAGSAAIGAVTGLLVLVWSLYRGRRLVELALRLRRRRRWSCGWSC